MIHTNNEIQEVKDLIEKKFNCDIKNITGSRATKIESYARRIFINILRVYLSKPLKIISIETSLSIEAVSYHLKKHITNKELEYTNFYKDCLIDFKKLFYDNLTELEKLNYHREEAKNIMRNLAVRNLIEIPCN